MEQRGQLTIGWFNYLLAKNFGYAVYRDDAGKEVLCTKVGCSLDEAPPGPGNRLVSTTLRTFVRHVEGDITPIYIKRAPTFLGGRTMIRENFEPSRGEIIPKAPITLPTQIPKIKIPPHSLDILDADRRYSTRWVGSFDEPAAHIEDADDLSLSDLFPDGDYPIAVTMLDVGETAPGADFSGTIRRTR